MHFGEKKNEWKETHHNVNSGFIALHFVILVMEKFKLIIKQDECIYRTRLYIKLKENSGRGDL